MKGSCYSYFVLIGILFLLLSPCDALFGRRRRRRSPGLRDEGFDARAKRETEMACKPESSHPNNGQVICSNGNNYQSVCKYTCDEGFKLSDPELGSRFCDEHGWSKKEPSCKE